MKIVVDSHWDERVIGRVTEGATVEDLERRIALLVPDLLGNEAKGPFEIELIANPKSGRQASVDHSMKSHHTANAILKQAGLPKAF